MKQLFYNGRIYTSDINAPYAEAFAVDNGIIVWIGRDSNIPDLDYDEKTDLNQKRVLPGFIDSHMHGSIYSFTAKQLPCLPPVIYSIEDLKKKIAEIRKNTKKGDWVLGWGFDEGKLKENRAPNRYDLDEACPDFPVCLRRSCAHIVTANSMALELAGITPETPDPQGGHIERDENGVPTGVLKENAKDLVLSVIPESVMGNIVDNITDMGKLLASQGLTAFTDMGDFNDIDYYKIYLDAVKSGLKQKVSVYYMWEYFNNKKNFTISEEDKDGNRQIHVEGLKLISDGSISGRTAWVEDPYLGSDDEFGISVCSDELLEDAIAACKKFKCQLSVHAMGGRAIDRILTRAAKEEKWNNRNTPHLRLEHLTEPSEHSMKLAAEHGVTFVTQPVFLYAEIESYIKNLGKERLKGCYPVKTLLDRGVKVALSTDSPATAWATPSDPFTTLKATVTRKAYDGTDCGDSEAVDIETAIRLYTKESAEVAGFDKCGMLREDYKADFIILDKDILDISPDEIDTVKVLNTYIDGEMVYAG